MSDAILTTLDQELDPEKAIREELDRLGLEGYELDPNAHISLEVLRTLKVAKVVGNPEEWMGANLGNTQELDKSRYHQQMLLMRRLIKKEFQDEPQESLDDMTYLANHGDVNNPDHRVKYQNAETFLMFYVIETLRDLMKEIPPEKTIQCIALRGAEFFVPDFTPFAEAGIMRIVTKRIKLKKKQFAVGLGEPEGLEEIDAGIGRENVEQIILPDDCLSTAMSQEMNIRNLFALGFRPKQIIVPVAVATTDGYWKLKQVENDLKHQYGHDFKLVIVAAGICQSVDEDMYLRTTDGENYLVGDMGEWNRDIHEGDDSNLHQPTAEQ